MAQLPLSPVEGCFAIALILCVANKLSRTLQDAHTSALLRNVNLTDLSLSSDFEVLANDTGRYSRDYAQYVRSYKRRLAATQDLAAVCQHLRRCNWEQILALRFSIMHQFIVEERASGHNHKTRVVRGVKQDWMGLDWGDWKWPHNAPCKLEDLPGDIVILPSQTYRRDVYYGDPVPIRPSGKSSPRFLTRNGLANRTLEYRSI